MAQVSGKVALITGAAQGLGRAFSEALLKNGAKVCLADVDVSLGETTADELSKVHGSDGVTFVKCDVTSQQDMENAFLKAKSSFGGLDIVCNNAGIANESQWEKVVLINLMSVIRGTLLGIEHMSRTKGGNGGTILNTASLAGLVTQHNTPAYNAAKHGVVAYTRSWAKNPACASMGLRFHALCPAFAKTAIVATDETKVIDMKTAAKLVEILGMMRPETVVDAFMELLGREDSSGEVLSVTEAHGTRFEKEARWP